MRSKTVTINGKVITINEQKIKQLKDVTIPKVGPAWKVVTSGDTSELVDNVGSQLKEVFPELGGIDLEECYPSELEAFLEAWIEVNFTGLKRLVGPLMSFVKMAQRKPVLDSAGLLENLTTGKK